MKTLDSQEQTYSKCKQGIINRKSLFTLFFLSFVSWMNPHHVQPFRLSLLIFFIPNACTYLHVTLFCLLVKFYSYLFLLKQRKKTVEHIIWHILYFCSHMRSSSLLTIWNTVQRQSNYLTCVSL